MTPSSYGYLYGWPTNGVVVASQASPGSGRGATVHEVVTTGGAVGARVRACVRGVRVVLGERAFAEPIL